MTATKRQTPKQKAIEGIAPIIAKLRELEARCMEQTLDAAGIVWERWLLPNGVSVVVMGTPHWRDCFMPTAPFTADWAPTLAGLAELAGRTAPPARPRG